MALKWNQTSFPGVRYRNHPTRKHGVRPDQYFAIRIQVDGKRKEEGLGWASQGWSAKKAADELSKLREAARTGEGHLSLADKREAARAEKRAMEEAKRASETERVTYGEVFTRHYMPHAEQTKKKGSVVAEKALYGKWIAPVIADKPMGEVAQIHLEKIRKTMADAGMAPRSIHYALCVVRQTYHFALDFGLHNAPSPTDQARALIRRIKAVDNKRIRFLSSDEAERLLAAVRKKSRSTHDIALLALFCGLRAGEVFFLTWADVDLENEMLTLRDTKSGQTRAAFMTGRVKRMLSERPRGKAHEFVFPSGTGKKRTKISNSFRKAVQEIGLNDGVTDPRQKAVFHTLRHTFASWLVMDGVALYTVQKLLGHASLAMTERYAHLAPDALRAAVGRLGAVNCEKIEGGRHEKQA